MLVSNIYCVAWWSRGIAYSRAHSGFSSFANKRVSARGRQSLVVEATMFVLRLVAFLPAALAFSLLNPLPQPRSALGPLGKTV